MQINEIFKVAVDRKASDIHLMVSQSPILRIEGDLTELTDFPILTKKSLEEMIYSLLTPIQKSNYIRRRELDISYEIPDISRFRVNLHWERNNPGLVARVISCDIPTLDEITMPKVVRDMTHIKQGLILVTGPTGCGKSTSLAALIELINQEQAKTIITLEDPIEFIFHSKKSMIMQRQLGTDMMTFKSGLKHVLRQDPNVIMVGEMRDLETIASTITLAETGHLVFATLHTYNAAQTIDRIIDIFPPYQQTQIRLQLAMTLQAVVSQRLLPKKSGGVRVAAREILINTPAVGNVIRENKIAQMKTIIQTSAEIGMISMDQSVRTLYNQGLITKEVAQTYMTNPEVLGK